MQGLQVDFKYSNDVELIDMVMILFSRTVLKQELTEKEKIVLREYLLNGYSKHTKETLRLTLKVKPQNINSFNYILQKKGFLNPHPSNQRMKVLNPQLLELKHIFLGEDERKIFMVNFVRRD